MKNLNVHLCGGHSILLDRGPPAPAAQLAGFPVQRKEIDRFWEKAHPILQWGRDVALGKHLSVGTCCFLEVGLRCLNTGLSLRCRSVSCVVPRDECGKLWVTCRSGVLPPSPTVCLSLGTHI